MRNNDKWGIDAWVEHISNKELPALSSTVRLLENLSKDDTMSLARVGQSVLHDYALTSTILKVANSSAYMGRAQVTTVSRAAVVLGFNTIKNICITAKLIGSLLKNKNLSEPVYTRLLKNMAKSYHAGMLTQMMMPDYDEDTKEETFISALLHHLGESAFWSSGGPATKVLDEQISHINPKNVSKINKVILQQLGTSFDKMTIGLAKSWNLGDHIIRAMEEPNLRTPEIQVVTLADRLSSCLADPKNSVESLPKLLGEIQQLTGFDEDDLKEKILQCTKQTEKMLTSYGADVLVQYLHPGASALPPEEDLEEQLSDEALQLQILRELTFLTMERGDFNVVIQTTLEGIYRGINMDRVMVLLKSGDKKSIEPRFISAPNAHEIKERFKINIKTMKTVFSHAFEKSEAIWVKSFDDEQYGKLINKPIRNITSPDGFFLAPIMWDSYCIGLFYADRLPKSDIKGYELAAKDFAAFTHFTQQANLCLSIILKKAGQD